MSNNEPQQRRRRHWIIIALAMMGAATLAIWIIAILANVLYFREMDEQERAREKKNQDRAEIQTLSDETRGV